MLWSQYVKLRKSPVRVLGAMLLRSRTRYAEKCRELRRRLKDGEIQNQEQQTVLERQQRTLREQQRQIRELQTELDAQAVRLPHDPPLKGHCYGPRLIALCIALNKIVGLRAAEQVLIALFEWLEVEQTVPAWTTMRTWMLRVGVAEMQAPRDPCDDMVWMADHSNQIGQEKVLVVLGVRAADLPPPGEPLQHEHMRPLCVKPGLSWKQEDVLKVYQDLAKQYGAPRAILSDGAGELRKPAAALMTQYKERQGGEGGLVLGDFKHFAAIQFKQLIGRGGEFDTFLSQVGACRSQIQQTELGHLSPRSLKQKARFMNLKPLLAWSEMIEWLLKTPEADCREGVSEKRLQAKLGWLKEHAANLEVWRECQTVISKCLTFLNEQGVQRGAARRLYKEIANDLRHETTRELARRLLSFVHGAEKQLKQGERLPLSTEILESSFGLYKQLEGQHSKGGFTTLLPSFAVLLKTITPERVRTALLSVSNADVKKWNDANLKTTLGAKRRKTQAEFKRAKQQQNVTQEQTAA